MAKMQGNFYNDAVIDPYMLERAEVMRVVRFPVLYGKVAWRFCVIGFSKRQTTGAAENSVQDGY